MTLIGGNEMNETSENQNGATRRPYLAMWGIRDQLCSHGNAMVSGTTVGAAEFEALAQDVLPDVMLHDEDDTVLIDPRLWGELQPAPLLARVREAARAQPDLRLPADGDADTLLKRASLLRAVAAGQHPELGEEIARLVGQVCGEAGQRVRQSIDLAADKAPCKVDAALNDLVPFLDQLAPINLGDEGAPARLSARCEQVAGLGKWRNALPAPTFDSLRLSLLDDTQDAYGRALDRLVTERFENRWEKERDVVREHLEHYLETSRDFRAKVRLCTDDFENSSRRAKADGHGPFGREPGRAGRTWPRPNPGRPLYALQSGEFHGTDRGDAARLRGTAYGPSRTARPPAEFGAAALPPPDPGAGGERPGGNLPDAPLGSRRRVL